jgi:hypothetical protein
MNCVFFEGGTEIVNIIQICEISGSHGGKYEV